MTVYECSYNQTSAKNHGQSFASYEGRMKKNTSSFMWSKYIDCFSRNIARRNIKSSVGYTATKAIREIESLKYNWNDNGAKPFSNVIIQRAFSIAKRLSFNPSVFPTARGTIQFEYEKDSGEYLELELFENKIHFFEIGTNGEEDESDISYNQINAVLKKVNSFCDER